MDKKKEFGRVILTVTDICEVLKISKPTAYELMKRGDFPTIVVGRCKRVEKDQFIKWIDESPNYRAKD
jgi:excisionase family DNA binding protein